MALTMRVIYFSLFFYRRSQVAILGPIGAAGNAATHHSGLTPFEPAPPALML
jgi:hypothetical protein